MARGIQLFDKGSNPGPLHWVQSLTRWTTRKVLNLLFHIMNMPLVLSILGIISLGYILKYTHLKKSRLILSNLRILFFWLLVCSWFTCGQEREAGCCNCPASLLRLWASYWNSGLHRFPQHQVPVNLYKLTKAFILARKCPLACFNQLKKNQNSAGEGRKECRFLYFFSLVFLLRKGGKVQEKKKYMFQKLFKK